MTPTLRSFLPYPEPPGFVNETEDPEDMFRAHIIKRKDRKNSSKSEDTKMDVNIGLKRAFRPRTGDRALEGPARSEAQKHADEAAHAEQVGLLVAPRPAHPSRRSTAAAGAPARAGGDPCNGATERGPRARSVGRCFGNCAFPSVLSCMFYATLYM